MSHNQTNADGGRLNGWLHSALQDAQQQLDRGATCELQSSQLAHPDPDVEAALHDGPASRVMMRPVMPT